MATNTLARDLSVGDIVTVTEGRSQTVHSTRLEYREGRVVVNVQLDGDSHRTLLDAEQHITVLAR